MNRWIVRSCVVWLFFVAGQAHSFIASVAVAPGNIQLNINTGLNASVQWTITLNHNHALSTQGEFRTVGKDGALAIVNTPLNITAPPNAAQPQPVIAAEAVSVSPSQAQQWWALGLRQVRYVRAFSDGQGSLQTAEVLINLVEGLTTSPGGVITTPSVGLTQATGLRRLRDTSSELQLHRLELRFTDKQTVKFVDSGEQLRAQLALSYSGNGILRGQWQLADPTSAQGDLRFRVLTLVSQQLSSVQHSEILSPILPTELVGRYYLRFCVTNIGGDTVAENSGDSACPGEILSTSVGYQVFPAKRPVATIKGLVPQNHQVTEETLFQWPEIADTNVYQLQILSLPEKESRPIGQAGSRSEHAFVVGMLLPADKTETTLSSYVRERLVNGRRYFWRLSAHGSDGVLIATSELIPFWTDE